MRGVDVPKEEIDAHGCPNGKCFPNTADPCFLERLKMFVAVFCVCGWGVAWEDPDLEVSRIIYFGSLNQYEMLEHRNPLVKWTGALILCSRTCEARLLGP